MYRFTLNSRLAMSMGLIVLVVGIAAAAPAQEWSTPVKPPAGCGSTPAGVPGLALNATGDWVVAGYFQNNNGNTLQPFTVQACTSDDGVNWSGPVTIGLGTAPAVAIAPDGAAVAIWQGGLATAPNVQASVRPAGGSWSAPVVISSNPGHPVIGMDESGNAVAAWAPINLTQSVETASLPAGGHWTAVHTLAAKGGGVNLATNSVGGVVVTWRSANSIEAASGTILGGFSAPVVVGSTYAGLSALSAPRVALNDAGQASLAWQSGTSYRVVTRAASGAWSTLTQLSANGSSGFGTAIDGAGNAIAAFGVLESTGVTTSVATYASLRPAGGTWEAPTLLSSLSDKSFGGVAGDEAGTFVVAWTNSAGTVEALTVPPGGELGPGTAVDSGPFMNLKIFSDHAVLWTGAGISSETVN
jgi:hypothetical protein